MPRPKKKKPNRADGLYEVKRTVGKRADGTPLRMSFYSSVSKEDASAKADEFITQQRAAELAGITIVKESPAFSVAAHAWLERDKKDHVKEYTYVMTYEKKVEKYLIPYFKDTPVNIIKPMDIQEFFNQHNYLSLSTLKKLLNILNGIFEFCLYNDLCVKNPVRKKKLYITSTYLSKERQVLSESQKKALFHYCIEHGDIDIILLLSTGIRRSELLGLTWDDINTKENYIMVTTAVTPEIGRSEEHDPKTKTSRRLIPISGTLSEFLERNRGEGYLFKGRSGKFLSPSSFAKRYYLRYQEIAKEINLPIVTPHELRHTFGTLLREEGSDLYTIQRALGHSTPTVTANIYIKNDLEVLRKDMKLT